MISNSTIINVFENENGRFNLAIKGLTDLNPETNSLGRLIRVQEVVDLSVNNVAQLFKNLSHVVNDKMTCTTIVCQGKRFAVKINDLIEVVNKINAAISFEGSKLNLSWTDFLPLRGEKVEIRLQHISDLRTLYTHFLSHFKPFKHPDEPLKYKTDAESGFTARTLQKVIEVVLPINDGKGLKALQNLSHDQPIQNYYGFISFENKQFIVKKEEDDLLKLFHCCLFVKGGIGQIYEVTNIAEPSFVQILKKVKQGSTPNQALENAQHEYDMLKLINGSESETWGFQKTPSAIVSLTPVKGSQRIQYALLEERYTCNYEDVLALRKCGDLTVSFIGLLVEIHQLLWALRKLGEKEIFHGDINSSNVLVNEDQEGNILLHLSDFGGAQKNGVPNQYTPYFVPQEDFDKVNELTTFINAYKSYEKDFKEKGPLFVRLEKIDVYQKGVILYETLTNGELPYPICQTSSHPLTNQETFEQARNKLEAKIKAQLELDGLVKDQIELDGLVQDQKHLIDLIMNMIHFHYEQRPTYAEAFHTFVKYLYTKDEYMTVRNFVKTKVKDALLVPKPLDPLIYLKYRDVLVKEDAIHERFDSLASGRYLVYTKDTHYHLVQKTLSGERKEVQIDGKEDVLARIDEELANE